MLYQFAMIVVLSGATAEPEKVGIARSPALPPVPDGYLVGGLGVSWKLAGRVVPGAKVDLVFKVKGEREVEIVVRGAWVRALEPPCTVDVTEENLKDPDFPRHILSVAVPPKDWAWIRLLWSNATTITIRPAGTARTHGER
jgi:hypothetical protein